MFVPLARLKNEDDQIRVPYSFQHLQESPEVEAGDELSAEDDRALRNFYAIGLADQEMVSNAQSYASQLPDEEGEARRIEASAAEGPVREIEETAGEKKRIDGDQSDEPQGRHDSEGKDDDQNEEDGDQRRREDEDEDAGEGSKDD